MTIGFIGLGIMGSRMAANLLKGEIDLKIHNRTKAKAEQLIKQGGKWVDSLSGMQDADIVFTMLAHPEAVQETALGEDGFLNQLQAGALWVDCSTVNPSFTRAMAAEAAKRGIKFVDAPVAGTKPQAQNGELVFLAGGAAEDIEACQPYFDRMGSRTAHVGENGMGTSLKVVVNLMLAQSMAAFAEVVSLGEGLGLSQQLLFNVLMGGPVVAPFVTTKREMLENQAYDDPQFPLAWMHKDVHMAAVSAYEVGVPLTLGNSTKELFQQAIVSGHGEKDFSAIYEFLTPSS